MTKKHFIALADQIRRVNQEAKDYGCTLPYPELAVARLADFCASQNPNFNRERWLSYIAGTCGKNGGRIS